MLTLEAVGTIVSWRLFSGRALHARGPV